MSELSELIKINKNIENQNKEIIRLLKKIAGEDEDDNQVSFEYVTLDSPYDDVEFSEADDMPQVLDDSLDVGEVFFIEEDVFKLSIKNNEICLDNLTGSDECIDYSLAEIIANESINQNQSLEGSTYGMKPSKRKIGSTRSELQNRLKLFLLRRSQKFQNLLRNLLRFQKRMCPA